MVSRSRKRGLCWTHSRRGCFAGNLLAGSFPTGEGQVQGQGPAASPAPPAGGCVHIPSTSKACNPLWGWGAILSARTTRGKAGSRVRGQANKDSTAWPGLISPAGLGSPTQAAAPRAHQLTFSWLHFHAGQSILANQRLLSARVNPSCPPPPCVHLTTSQSASPESPRLPITPLPCSRTLR